MRAGDRAKVILMSKWLTCTVPMNSYLWAYDIRVGVAHPPPGVSLGPSNRPRVSFSDASRPSRIPGLSCDRHTWGNVWERISQQVVDFMEVSCRFRPESRMNAGGGYPPRAYGRARLATRHVGL